MRTKHAVDVELIVPRLRNNKDAHLDYLRHLKESVETIHDIVEEAKVVRPLDRSIVSACRYTQHSQELLEYAIGTCSQGSQQRAKQLAHTPLIRKKKVTAIKTSDRQDSNKNKHVVTQKTQKTNVPVPHSKGVKRYPNASGSQPKSNHKTNRISPAKGANKLPVEDLPRTNKSHPKTTNRVDSSSRLTRTVVEVVLWYLDSGCSKHITGDGSRLLNFMKKFTGTVRFGNDHFGAIMGYGDYVVGESVISRVYYVKGLGHNLFSVGQFCDFDLEVAFRKHSCYVRDTDGVDLIKGSRGSNLYAISVEDMMKVFGALCYPTNDSKDLGKLQPTADTGIFVGYAPSRKVYQIYNKRTRRPAPNFLTPRQISSGLVPNLVLATPYAPPPIKNWRFYFNQCSKNIWTLLRLTDRVLLLKQYKLQSPQPVKENPKKDKIGSKPDKNEKRGKAGKSQKQLHSELAKLTHEVNQQTSAVTTAMTAMLKQFQSNPPPAQVKAVEEICVTCGGAHPYYQCLTAGGNTFPEFRDNIQGYVSVAAGNFNQGNLGYRPQGGELKAITTRSGLVTEGPTVLNPPKSVNQEEDECVEETYTDLDHAEYTIKVPPPPPVQKPKPLIQRNFVLHTRDSLPPHIPYPSRMLKQKQHEKDDIQIQKFWNIFKQLHLNITLAEALVLMPKYQKMLKALLSNKEKLQELANTPLNENCSAVILKKLPEKLGDLGSLPDLIPTRMTLELANRAICTPDGIARDVFVSVGKFTSPADFVVVDYESDPRVPLILGRPFLRTARALIDVNGEEMILGDEDERLNLNMKHDTTSYSNHPNRESVNLINIFNLEDCLEDLVSNKLSGNPTFSLYKEIASPEDFSKDDDLPSPDNEDKDFDPPIYELLVFKEVPNSVRLLPFSFENEEKVFKPGIYTSKK
nr:integrase, catalytic region, zinc finger, CCHC-type, peptidase aspartic, catalytic [Tanacetum cinerariifolium]